jgi:Icc-related predicted phosphoesterase
MSRVVSSTVTVVVVIGLSIALVGGCGRSGEPKSDERHNEKFLRCAQPYDDGTEEVFQLTPLVVKRDGYDLKIQGITRGLIVVGLLAGIGETNPSTEKNIDFFLEQFKGAGVQAILVPGGIGLSRDHVKWTLELLSKAPVPVLIVPGAEENFDVFRQEIAAIRKTRPQIIDFSLVRRVQLGNLTFVSLPGYDKPFYLRAGHRGCAFGEQDLKKTGSLFEKTSRTNVIVSPTPPRGTSEKSVDRGRGNVNIGSPSLTHILKSAQMAFGLFGYVFESGGHGTLNDGSTPIGPAVWQESLFLQVGSAGSTPISLINEGRSAGMAQIVEFSGNRSRFRTIWAGPNTQLY